MNKIFTLILSRFATGSPPGAPRQAHTRPLAAIPLLLLGLALAGAGALHGQSENFEDLYHYGWSDNGWTAPNTSPPEINHVLGEYTFHYWQMTITGVASPTEMEIDVECLLTNYVEYSILVDTTWGLSEVAVVDPGTGARLWICFGTDGSDDIQMPDNHHHYIVFGMDGDDDIYPQSSGNAAWYLIFGGGGVDYINVDGGQGTHFLYGDWLGPLVSTTHTPEGVDTIIGGPNNDWIEGGPMNDVLFGMDGSDEMYGGEGDDVIYGGIALGVGDGNDLLFGGPGNDTLFGGEEDTLYYGEGGSDNIWCGGGWSTAYGGDGDDLIVGGPDGGYFYGESGNDVIIATGGWCELYAGTGDDLLVAGDGDPSTFSDLFGEFGTNHYITSDAEDAEYLFLGHSSAGAYIWRDGGDVVDNANGSTVYFEDPNGGTPNWHDSNPWVMATQFWTTVHSGRN